MSTAAFSTEQQRLLAAMGYTLLQRRAPAAGPLAPPGTLVLLDSGAPAAVDAPLVAAIARVLDRPAPASAARLELGEGETLVIDLADLRAQPREKSALWRRLRGLRRRDAEEP